jgi:hypothetical protein
MGKNCQKFPTVIATKYMRNMSINIKLSIIIKIYIAVMLKMGNFSLISTNILHKILHYLQLIKTIKGCYRVN